MMAEKNTVIETWELEIFISSVRRSFYRDASPDSPRLLSRWLQIGSHDWCFSRPVIESQMTLRSPLKDEDCWVSGRHDTTRSLIHCGVDLHKLNELPAASRELAGCRVAWARPLQQWEGYLRGHVLKELHIAPRAFKGVWQFCAHWQLGNDMKMCVWLQNSSAAAAAAAAAAWPGSCRQWRWASTERLACWEVKQKNKKKKQRRSVESYCDANGRSIVLKQCINTSPFLSR